jgi:hypothetical protein
MGYTRGAGEKEVIMTDNTGGLGLHQIDAVLKYLPLFEREGFSPGTWHTRPGEVPFFLLRPEVDAFVRTLYKQKVFLAFDWTQWKGEVERYQTNPKLLQQADLLTIRKLLTAHVRADRFTEAHLGTVFERGHIVAILRRLKRIRQDMTGGD